MCGIFMQIAGMSFGLYFTDMLIKPVRIGRSEFSDIAMFLVKGAVQFFIWKWFQCTSTGGYSKNPLQGMSFMEIIVAGVIGGVTLYFSGQLVKERTADGFGEILLKYGIEAVILNFVYGASKNMITSAAASAGGTSTSGH